MSLSYERRRYERAINVLERLVNMHEVGEYAWTAFVRIYIGCTNNSNARTQAPSMMMASPVWFYTIRVLLSKMRYKGVILSS